MADSLLKRLLQDGGAVADDQTMDDAMVNYEAEADQLERRRGKNAFLFAFFVCLLLVVSYYGLKTYVFKKRGKINLADHEGQTDYVRSGGGGVTA
jgi:hypothetical protein